MNYVATKGKYIYPEKTHLEAALQEKLVPVVQNNSPKILSQTSSRDICRSITVWHIHMGFEHSVGQVVLPVCKVGPCNIDSLCANGSKEMYFTDRLYT